MKKKKQQFTFSYVNRTVFTLQKSRDKDAVRRLRTKVKSLFRQVSFCYFRMLNVKFWTKSVWYVNSSLHVAWKYSRILVCGHNMFPRAKLEEMIELWGSRMEAIVFIIVPMFLQHRTKNSTPLNFTLNFSEWIYEQTRFPFLLLTTEKHPPIFNKQLGIFSLHFSQDLESREYHLLNIIWYSPLLTRENKVKVTPLNLSHKCESIFSDYKV